MGNERVILCGGLAAPSGVPKKATVPLHLWGKDKNVALKISDVSRKMAANIPAVLVDLLEIATYVYCADQATTRGGNGAKNYGAKWRRRFQFHIPVRDPEVWSSEPVLTALRDTLGFLSDDEYEFTFKKLSNPPSVEQYLDFGLGGATGFQAEEVILFSGGIDSLGGAIQEAVVGKKEVTLVSHRSSPKIAKRQKDLLGDLGKHFPTRPFHVPVWINKDKALGREFTQRTRSFLYACLAAVVARIFGLWRIRFYENGAVSINLPISPQVVGGRATRTTHPQVLNGFSDLFSALFQKPFAVENPFLWMTKAQVVRSVRDAGCADLIKYTVSCTKVWEITTLKTHCGALSRQLRSERSVGMVNPRGPAQQAIRAARLFEPRSLPTRQVRAQGRGRGAMIDAKDRQQSMLIRNQRAELERLRAENRALREAAEAVVREIDAVGSPSLGSFDKLRAALAKSKEESCAT